MKSKLQEQWKAECEMRALRIISDLRDGSMQRWEVSPEDWRWIKRVQNGIRCQEIEEALTVKQLLPKR